MKTDYIVKHSCEMTREDKLEMEFVETIFAIRIKEKDVSEMAIVNRCYNPEDVDLLAEATTECIQNKTDLDYIFRIIWKNGGSRKNYPYPISGICGSVPIFF